MATLDEKILELETRIEQLETTIRLLVNNDARDSQPESNTSLSQTALLGLMKTQGVVREPTVEERERADEWDRLSATEKQAHMWHMQSLPMTSLLSQIVIENRR